MSESEAHTLEIFIRENYDDVYRFLYSKTQSVHDAEDLTQETFLRYAKSLDSSSPTSKGRAYLFTIARNVSIDHFRAQKPQTELLSDSLEETFGFEDTASDGFDELIQELPKENIEILSLRYAQGFSINEIASITKKSRFAIRRKINASLSALRATWEEGTE